MTYMTDLLLSYSMREDRDTDRNRNFCVLNRSSVRLISQSGAKVRATPDCAWPLPAYNSECRSAPAFAKELPLLFAAFDDGMRWSILGDFRNFDWLQLHRGKDLFELAEDQRAVDRLQSGNVGIDRAEPHAEFVAAAILEVMEVLQVRFFLGGIAEVLDHGVFGSRDLHPGNVAGFVFRMLALGEGEPFALVLGDRGVHADAEEASGEVGSRIRGAGQFERSDRDGAGLDEVGLHGAEAGKIELLLIVRLQDVILWIAEREAVVRLAVGGHRRGALHALLGGLRRHRGRLDRGHGGRGRRHRAGCDGIGDWRLNSAGCGLRTFRAAVGNE